MKETLKIDRTNWTRVTFGDVVFEPKENAKDIYNEGIEHVVGLEHIDSENTHLTRSGKLEETTTFSKKFRKGDVLFGRRRAYLKKAALAGFDGICSGDITVFRAKKNLLPELIPFIVNNEKFFDYAIKHSAGGLSPRVKFKDLANYEFLLPPKDQQAQLAELLWALDEVIEREREVLERMKVILELKLKEFFEFPLIIKDEKKSGYMKTEIGWMPNEYELVQQKDIVEFINGRAYKKEEWENSGTPVIRLQNLTGTGEEFYYSSLELPEKNYCKNGDLLFMWSATFGAVIWKGERAIFHYHIWNVKCDNEKIRQQFMFYNLEEITRRMMRQVSGSTMPHITKEGMEKLKIGLPPLYVQDEIVSVLDQISETINSIESKIASSQALQKSLINQIF